MSICLALHITPDQARRITQGEIEALNRVIKRSNKR